MPCLEILVSLLEMEELYTTSQAFLTLPQVEAEIERRKYEEIEDE